MGYAVGVDLGTTQTTVAIARWDNAFPSRRRQPRVVASMPSVGYLGEDGTLLIGQDAHERGVSSPHRVVRDFKRRIGDNVPIVVEGWRERPENVFAAMVLEAVNQVVGREGVAPEAVVVTYPSGWGAYKQKLLIGALQAAGLTDVLLVSEAAAAVARIVPQANFAATTVAVYDLGGSSFDAAVIAISPENRVGDSRDADGCYELLGVPQQVEWLGGADFDQAVYSLVQEGASLPRLSQADRTAVAAMGQIRRDCVAAKIALSLDTETTIPVVLPQLTSRVRLVRSEFEELIRDSIEETLDVLRTVICSAGLTPDDLDGIVLAGGSSGIPLVAQMISAEFSRPLMVDAGPDSSIALGAAELAVRAVNQVAAVPTPAAPPATAADSGLALVAAVSLSGADRAAGAPRTDRHDVQADRQVESVTNVGLSSSMPMPKPVPASKPIPVPGTPGSAEPPAEEAVSKDEAGEPRGRHRHRPGRRYWLRGLVASIAAVVVAGSSLAASKAAESDPPAEQATDVTADPVGRGPAPVNPAPGGAPSAQLPDAGSPGTVGTAADTQTADTATAEAVGDPVIPAAMYWVRTGTSVPITETPATDATTTTAATATTPEATIAGPPADGSDGEGLPPGTAVTSPSQAESQLVTGLGDAARAAVDQEAPTTVSANQSAGGAPEPATPTESPASSSLPPVEATVETPAATDTAVDQAPIDQASTTDHPEDRSPGGLSDAAG